MRNYYCGFIMAVSKMIKEYAALTNVNISSIRIVLKIHCVCKLQQNAYI